MSPFGYILLRLEKAGYIRRIVLKLKLLYKFSNDYNKTNIENNELVFSKFMNFQLLENQIITYLLTN